ncbi:hypothetical protein D3C84_579420 [compost metagenome]
MIAARVGNRRAQRPFIGPTGATVLPVTFCELRVACGEGAAAGRQLGVIAQLSLRQAAPDGQGTRRITGRFQRIRQWQTTATVAEFFRGLVVDDGFTRPIRHGATAQGPIVACDLRVVANGLLHRVALTFLGQLRQQLAACGGIDAIEQRHHAFLLRRGRRRRGIEPRQPLQQGNGQLAVMTVIGVFEPLLRVFALAGVQRQIRCLIERTEVAGLLVVSLPERRGFCIATQGLHQFGPAFDHVSRLWLAGEPGHDFVALALVLPDVQQPCLAATVPGFGQARALQQLGVLQALGQNQPFLRVIVRLAATQLRACGLRIATGHPFGRLQARALQFATQALHGRYIAALSSQFPQALALRRIRQFAGGQ